MARVKYEKPSNPDRTHGVEPSTPKAPDKPAVIEKFAEIQEGQIKSLTAPSVISFKDKFIGFIIAMIITVIVASVVFYINDIDPLSLLSLFNLPSSSGYCYSNSDCSGFASRNCGGANLARCGSDNLCHCCLTVRQDSCISCSTGCGGGTICMGDACAFNTGGYTYQ